MSRENTPAALASIKFLTGPLAGRTFSINQSITTIGRNAENDIVISDDRRVSRQHARLLWNNGSWSIEKLSQASNVIVAGQSVQQAVLSDGTQFFTQVREQAASDTFRQTIPPQPPPVEPRPYLPIADQPTPPPASSSSGHIQRSDATQAVRPSPQLGGTAIAPLSAIGIPSIEVSDNTTGKKQTHLLTKDVINVGRDATNDVVIDDRIVSGLHLRIVRQGNQLVLIHPNPANQRQRTLNGLLYQGRKIRGDEPFSKTLTNGDIFRIGDENGTLITLTYNDGTGASQEVLPAMQPIRLSKAELTIGRNSDNDVVLTHPQVSAHHARLVREGGTYRILDQNSTNHVYVNSQLVTSQVLRLGDEIRIGPFRLLFEGDQLKPYDESNFIRINAQNLRKTGNNNVVLLNNISITIPPRKFVALVGGSGAGKSTLMDALNGLRPAQQGKVLYNGQDYYRNIPAFSTLLGYVPQDDIVHRDL
ncbi:MAG: FHA domain-containing protein, partial [Chloroflexi bacterium]